MSHLSPETPEITSSTPTIKYLSIYSPGVYVTYPQYLAEKMCQRYARHLNTDLPKKFWYTSKRWSGYFHRQLKLARDLNEKHHHKSINQAVQKLRHTFSLKNKKLLAMIIENDTRLPLPEKQEDIIPMGSSGGRFNRKSGKLGKLDG